MKEEEGERWEKDWVKWGKKEMHGENEKRTKKKGKLEDKDRRKWERSEIGYLL